MLRPSELEQVVNEVMKRLRFRSGAGLSTRYDGKGNISIINTVPEGFYVKLTGYNAITGTYAWTKMDRASAGGFTVSDDGVSGDGAYEVHGAVITPMDGTVIAYLRYGYGGGPSQEFLFEAPGQGTGGPSSGSNDLVYVKVTSQTPTSGRYPGKFSTYDPVANTFTDDTDPQTAWITFPNGQVPSLSRYSAIRYTDLVSGYPVCSAFENPITVAATNAGTGDSTATYYGILTLNVNMITGLSLSNSGSTCTIAAQEASLTHAGVVGLGNQTLGDGTKTFDDNVVVNNTQSAGTALTVKKNGSATPAFEVTGNGTARVNTTASTYTLEIGGTLHTTSDAKVDGKLDVIGNLDVNGSADFQGSVNMQSNLTVLGTCNVVTGYQVNGIGGAASATYNDGIQTTINVTGGLVMSIT